MATALTRERALAALPHLVDAAKRCELIMYGDLASKIGCHPTRCGIPWATSETLSAGLTACR